MPENFDDNNNAPEREEWAPASDSSLMQPSGKRTRNAMIITVIAVLLVVILGVASALIVKRYVVSTFVVQGTSMWPTLDGGAGAEMDTNLTNGEILYLNKVAKIKRGDIIVCTPDWWDGEDEEKRSVVKRVIGIAGDTVAIRDGKTYLNGNLLEESYIREPMICEDGEWKVGDGEVFCMGDNRNESLDSRIKGPVPLSCVEGKCFLIKGINGKFRKP